jgi:hypothetical protein
MFCIERLRANMHMSRYRPLEDGALGGGVRSSDPRRLLQARIRDRQGPTADLPIHSGHDLLRADGPLRSRGILPARRVGHGGDAPDAQLHQLLPGMDVVWRPHLGLDRARRARGPPLEERPESKGTREVLAGDRGARWPARTTSACSCSRACRGQKPTASARNYGD